MRICHFSDSHLGAGESHPVRNDAGLTLRQQDVVDSFIESIDKVIALKPDLCLHTGDLFHSVRPMNRIMALAAEPLHRLAAEANIPTVVITGNHDAPRQPHLGAAVDVFRQIPGLNIASRYRAETFAFSQCHVTALPHCLTPDLLMSELAKCAPEPSFKFNILMLHGVAAGMPQFAMADLGEQEFPIELLELFEYAALGHYHNSCPVTDRAWYAGSTERLSQAERESSKGFLEVSLEPFSVTFHEVHSREMVDLTIRHLAGERGDTLVKRIQTQLEEIESSGKIVRVKVQGSTSELLKTIPSEELSVLKSSTFSLDIRFEKDAESGGSPEFGPTSIGRLDQAFLDYLDTVTLDGLDRDRLVQTARKYLTSEE